MTDTIDRKRVGVRLDAETIAQTRALAATETEGNLSQMLRRLVTEALATRRVTTAGG